MPLSHGMLLGASAAGFDAVIHFNGSYSSSSGSSNSFDASISGSLDTVSDPKGIIVDSRTSVNLSSFILETGETYEMSVIDNFSYSGNANSDRVAIRSFFVLADGTTTDSINLTESIVNTFTNSGGANNFKDFSFTLSGGDNGIAVVLNKSGAGGTFSASGGLKLGITKTS